MQVLLALVIIDTAVVVLLTVLVAGLLRSHADILRALHSLGAGVGDPSVDPTHPPRSAPSKTRAVPLTLGPPLPAQRATSTIHDVVGVAPDGSAVAVSVANGDHLTLLVFLSSGCSTCAGIWDGLARGQLRDLGTDVRPVVVTKSPDLELPGEIRRRSTSETTVVMSSDAWSDYEVPGSPFFVLVDGPGGRRLGEGVASHLSQVSDLVRRALADSGPRARAPEEGGGSGASALNGPAREARNDAELLAAGILPGDRSLYPSSLSDIYGPGSPPPATGTGLETEPGRGELRATDA